MGAGRWGHGADRLRHGGPALTVVVMTLVAGIAALSWIPGSTAAYRLQVNWTGRSPSTATSVILVEGFPTHVTIHFALVGGALLMGYWVRGPGAMAPHQEQSMSFGGSNYDFWTWGGTYVVGAGDPVATCPYPCPLSGEALVWANVTSGYF
ncbi:MAG TPA: hypothetical protein VEY07_03690 [Thermoplasmata archaeon]|nr:hypothetical protein [Thermoplasmata archaeon]